jgi:hypothetical protein
VELFFNLLWLALSSLILSFWLLRRNRWADDSLRSGVAVQLIAVALLIVVLLPVVSLTDDLQACTMPAESEHLSRRGDFQTIADFSLHAVSVMIAGSDAGALTRETTPPCAQPNHISCKISLAVRLTS